MARTAKPGGRASTRKKARSVDTGSTQDLSPYWSFQEVDCGGPWSFRKVEGTAASNLVDKLREFQRMTWTEIEGTQHHSIQCSSIKSEAQRRLYDIGKGAEDTLFSFGLGGRLRLWGIRRGRVFCILWWDPKHQIYPSPKKHT